MQETAKVNYVQYGKSTKSKKGKKSTQSGAGANSHRGVIGAMEQVLNPVERVGSFHSCKTLATDVGKADTKRYRTAKLLDMMCRGCGKKGHFEKVCLKKCSTHSLEVPQASTTSSAGAGASEPLYFDDEGQPVYTYMVSVPHVNKHLIKFLIALDHTTLRGNREGWNNMENSTKSTAHSPQSVLLKADTGANVNLMNRKTFDELFGQARGSASTDTYQNGKLWKYCSESARDVPCISEVEG